MSTTAAKFTHTEMERMEWDSSSPAKRAEVAADSHAGSCEIWLKEKWRKGRFR